MAADSLHNGAFPPVLLTPLPALLLPLALILVHGTSIVSLQSAHDIASARVSCEVKCKMLYLDRRPAFCLLEMLERESTAALLSLL